MFTNALPRWGLDSSHFQEVSVNFREWIRVTRDKIFRIINSDISLSNSVIHKEDVRQIDEPLTHHEILARYPIGKEYFYKKVCDWQVIRVKLLRIEKRYAIFTTGKQWIKVEVSNLVNRLEDISNNVIFPDFSKESLIVKEQKAEPREPISYFQDRQVTPKFILDAFAPHLKIGRTEHEVLMRTPFSTLAKLHQSRTHITQLQSMQFSDFPILSKDQESCLETLLSVQDPTLRSSAENLFKKSYLHFLKTRENSVLSSLMIQDSLSKMNASELFTLVSYYDDWSEEQSREFTDKIQRDIHIFLRATSDKNDILTSKLKQYLKPAILSKRELEEIYALSSGNK